MSFSKAFGPHVLDFGLISASILIGFLLLLKTFLWFFDCVFQVSFSKAFGPHFLDFGLISTSILKAFSLTF